MGSVFLGTHGVVCLYTTQQFHIDKVGWIQGPSGGPLKRITLLPVRGYKIKCTQVWCIYTLFMKGGHSYIYKVFLIFFNLRKSYHITLWKNSHKNCVLDISNEIIRITKNVSVYPCIIAPWLNTKHDSVTSLNCCIILYDVYYRQ